MANEEIASQVLDYWFAIEFSDRAASFYKSNNQTY